MVGSMDYRNEVDAFVKKRLNKNRKNIGVLLTTLTSL